MHVQQQGQATSHLPTFVYASDFNVNARKQPFAAISCCHTCTVLVRTTFADATQVRTVLHCVDKPLNTDHSSTDCNIALDTRYTSLATKHFCRALSSNPTASKQGASPSTSTLMPCCLSSRTATPRQCASGCLIPITTLLTSACTNADRLALSP